MSSRVSESVVASPIGLISSKLHGHECLKMNLQFGFQKRQFSSLFLVFNPLQLFPIHAAKLSTIMQFRPVIWAFNLRQTSAYLTASFISLRKRSLEQCRNGSTRFRFNDGCHAKVQQTIDDQLYDIKVFSIFFLRNFSSLGKLLTTWTCHLAAFMMITSLVISFQNKLW